jgi:hypothetical protein
VPSNLRDNEGVTGRALLIGSETYGLAGCNADVALMREVLGSRGFDAIDTRTDADASRAGIIDGMEALIGAIRHGDAALVYYSGHGGRVTRPDFEARKAAGLTVHFQFIVPHDMPESDSGDFRGVLSEELTQFQRRLTDTFRSLGEVPNVTTVLDCCHSGFMARAIDARQKSVDLESKMFRIRGIREHAEQLSRLAEIGGLVTNPDAVRLVACQPEQSAFESASKRGGSHGALTDAFASVLEQIGSAPIAWSTIGDLVRRRVRTIVPEQRPEVEGPIERILFSTDSIPELTAIPVTSIDGVATIEAAALLGFAVGDEFRLVVPGREEPLGAAVVSAIVGGAAILEVSDQAAETALADTAVAIPTRTSVPKVLVNVGFEGAGAKALRQSINGSPRIAVSSDQVGGFVTVMETDKGLDVLDQAGAPWRTDQYPDTADGHRQVVELLEQLAVGQRLLDLPSGAGANALAPCVDVGFGLVEHAERRSLALHGERLPSGSQVFLTLHNNADQEVFAWVFDVGVSGRASLLTDVAKSGARLGPAGSEDDTLDVWGPEGETLFWPNDVPTQASPGSVDGARPETFVLLFADRRGDLSSLASRPKKARAATRSPLDLIIDEARRGVREVAPADAGAAPLRYRIDRIEFLLLPAPS